MLYVFAGANREVKRKRVSAMRAIAEKESSLLDFSRDAANISIDELLEWSGTEAGLFGEKIFVVLDSILENEEILSFIEEKGGELAASKSIFIILQEKLSAAQKKALTHTLVAVESFDTTADTKQSFSIFALTDAFCARDKKQTWAILQKTLEKASPEEVHGTLWWQVKILLQISDAEAGGAEALGIKPFVYSKAKQALKKYSRKEIEAIGTELVAMYHDAHRGIGEFSMRLEQLILKRV